MTQPNTIIENEAAYHTALACCRGSYQEDIIEGRACLSGADLAGKARTYAGRYAASRDALLGRLSAAGVEWCERRGRNNKRILVLGASR